MLYHNVCHYITMNMTTNIMIDNAVVIAMGV